MLSTRSALFGLGCPLLVAVAGTAAPRAHADTYGYYANHHDCYMFVHGMPDFDQKRDAAPGILGLPADSEGVGGAMFCVPTAATDLLGYVNRHGYPNAYGPGVANFESNNVAVYNNVTSVIDNLGQLMGTTGDGGTSGPSNIRGKIQQVLNNSAPGLFDVYHFGLQEDWCPNTWDMAQYALAGGAVMFCYGRWQHDGAALTERETGHCVALTRIDHRAWVPDYTGFIGFANPSNSSSTTTQAAFAEQTESISNDLFFRDNEAIIMSKINFNISDPNDTRWRLIDSVYVVYPREGFSNWPDNHSITRWGFNQGSISGSFSSQTWTPPDGHDVGSFAVQPDRTGLVILTTPDPTTGDPGAIFSVNMLSGEWSQIDTAQASGQLVFGRDQYLYALLGQELVCYDLKDRIAEQARVSLPAGFAPDAIAYDDANDQIVAVSGAANAVARFPKQLRDAPTFEQLPSGVGLSGNLALDISPADGSLWIADRDHDRASQFVHDANGNLRIGARISGPDLGGISAALDGNIYASMSGQIVELAPDGRGDYVEVPDSHLAGLEAGDQLYVTRGRSNVDPTGPGWTDSPADEVEFGVEVPPCRVDYAQPYGTLDFFDVQTYLALFSSNHPDADFAAPYGTFDFFDLAQFLAEFSAGCP